MQICKKTDVDQSQINNLHYFPLYLDCQNNHYEVDLLEKSTFKPIPYSSWMTNITQLKPFKGKLYKKDLFSSIDKESLTDNVNLSDRSKTDLKDIINHVFNLHDPLDTTPLSKIEI